MNTPKPTRRCCRNKAADIYPGVDVDIADNEKVSKKLEKNDVKELNNNPRDNNLDE